MGIYKELQKHLGSSVQNYIIAGRTAQGYEDWKRSIHEERLAVVSRWHEVQIELDNEKELTRHSNFQGPHCLLKSQQASFEQKKKARHDKKRQKKEERAKANSQVRHDSPGSATRWPHRRHHPSVNMAQSDNATFEEAIQTSVAATSQGDPEQDKIIERAIRASVLELKSASKEGDNEAVQRAIQASIVEATLARKEKSAGRSTAASSDDDHHEEELKEALQMSIIMQDEAGSKATRPPLAAVDFDDSGIDTDDDQNMKTAIEQSKYVSQPGSTANGDVDLQRALEESRKAHAEYEQGSARKPGSTPNGDVDLQRALEESRKAHAEHEEGAARAKIEDAIVLDHVKRLSLVEGHGGESSRSG